MVSSYLRFMLNLYSRSAILGNLSYNFFYVSFFGKITRFDLICKQETQVTKPDPKRKIR